MHLNKYCSEAPFLHRDTHRASQPPFVSGCGGSWTGQRFPSSLVGSPVTLDTELPLAPANCVGRYTLQAVSGKPQSFTLRSSNLHPSHLLTYSVILMTSSWLSSLLLCTYHSMTLLKLLFCYWILRSTSIEIQNKSIHAALRERGQAAYHIGYAPLFYKPLAF